MEPTRNQILGTAQQGYKIPGYLDTGQGLYAPNREPNWTPKRAGAITQWEGGLYYFDGAEWVLIGGATSFESYTKTLLSGFSVTIPQSEHGLSKVTGVTTLNASRKEIGLAVTINEDDSVLIESNVNFLNFIITLY